MNLFLLILISLVTKKIFESPSYTYNFDISTTLPLRGILAVSIIIHHITKEYDFSILISDINISPINIFQSMGASIVAVFFFLSGYGLAHSYIRGGNRISMAFYLAG